MTKLKSLWKKPTKTFELILSEKISWFKVFLFFSSNGIVFSYYLMKSKGLIKIESFKETIISIIMMLIFGIIYGVISNFSIGFFIKQTGKIFGGKNDLKKIYNVLSWSYLPSTFSVYFIIVNILMARVLTTEIESIVAIILALLVGIFSLAQAILGIWQLILIFKGLKVAQELNSLKTILNYITGAGIFGIIYYYLIFPHL
ncbi:Yip1 family protein [Polaribacter sp. Q13]|uniref:Yip1 family protein n=1 Tax=Polaribacter sp. Q13 TaxID=2806551 RepID=UPI001C012BEB|nr:Yip1 family protein [Polaribacter sp. Q13]QVY66856.1 YIP1 family protein [Polaribacter sp. Q13]